MPNLAYVWGKYEQNVIAYEREGYIACFAAKWDGRRVFSKSLQDYKGYKPGSADDRALVFDIWKLFDEADIIVAQNGDRFDIRKMNARFIFHKLPPPSPYKTVDTKKIAKRVAMFNSNKLDDLGVHLGEGKKIKTDFELWQGCMLGQRAAWKKMTKYCQQDVLLLEKIYLRLRPWAVNHPNMGTFLEQDVCPRCGSVEIIARGWFYGASGKHRRFSCKSCGAWSHQRKKEPLTLQVV